MDLLDFGLQLSQEAIDKIVADEKTRYFSKVQSDRKLKQLADEILAKCHERGFRLKEFERLIRLLEVALEDVKQRTISNAKM
jgi:hypothetical protein